MDINKSLNAHILKSKINLSNSYILRLWEIMERESNKLNSNMFELEKIQSECNHEYVSSLGLTACKYCLKTP